MSSVFGDELRRLRLEKHRTQTELAQHLGYSTSYVSDVERGSRSPFEDEVLRAIEEYLGLDQGVLDVAAARTKGEVTIKIDDDHPLTLVDTLVRVKAKAPELKDASTVQGILRKLVSKSVWK